MKSRLALVFMLVFAVFGCSEAAGKSERPADKDEAVAARGEHDASQRSAEEPSLLGDASAAAVGERTTAVDLLALFHLADVHGPEGLFIDFGTAARAKYTNGNWNSGWQSDLVEGGVPVSTFAKTGRLYIPVEAVHPMQLRVRVKAYAAGPLITYLNGKTLEEHRVAPGDGFVELVIPLPEKHLKRGENAVLFRATRTRQTRGKPRSFAFDWARLEPGGAEGLPSPARVAPAKVSVDGDTRLAVQLPPGAHVDWFAEVTPAASLSFAAAAAPEGSLRVSIASDRNHSARRDFSLGASWSDRDLALQGLTGEVVLARFTNTGESVVALGRARISSPKSDDRPIEQRARNVIVLLIDTLRASKLSVYNPKTRVRTPALDAFAAEGTVFERPQSPENWTKPAVASVLTSLHPATHGTKQDASKLPRSALMLSEIYKKAGFRTASFIANGYVSNAFGFDQGWDHYTNYIRERRNTNASNVFGEAAAWIEKNKDKRFFAYIQTIDPHVPYDPPDEYLKMYDPKPYHGKVQNRRTHLMLDDAKKHPKKYQFTKRDKERIEALHDGEISYHDEYFGRFLAKLEELGLAQDTIFVITSDHGEEFQEHGSWGHGHSVYQELLGVPLLFRWPDVIPKGARVGPVVSTMDIAPTVLEATGVSVPKELEGRSLLGFMRGDWPLGPHVAFSDFLDHRRVIRGGDWKLIIRGNLSQVMFDLADDPWERRELNGQENPIAQRYLRTLHGQFLGASDRGRWLAARSDGGTAKRLSQEKQQMTPELCRQLVALGYISAECDEMLKN